MFGRGPVAAGSPTAVMPPHAAGGCACNEAANRGEPCTNGGGRCSSQPLLLASLPTSGTACATSEEGTALEEASRDHSDKLSATVSSAPTSSASMEVAASPLMPVLRWELEEADHPPAAPALAATLLLLPAANATACACASLQLPTLGARSAAALSAPTADIGSFRGPPAVSRQPLSTVTVARSESPAASSATARTGFLDGESV